MGPSTKQPTAVSVSLHGAPCHSNNSGGKDVPSTAVSRTAVLLRINEQVMHDLRQCSQASKTIQLLAGKTPKIRYDTKTLDLQLTNEPFHHELYLSNSHTSELSFAALVTQHVDLRHAEKHVDATSGADAALAALKQSLASFAHDKEAKKATISSTVIPATKNGRHSLYPNRLQASNKSPYSQSPSPFPNSSTPRLGPAQTSAPSTEHDAIAKMKAMAIRRVALHFLASHPASEKAMRETTRVLGRAARMEVLGKVAMLTEDGHTWKLMDKSFKELDVWKFPYKLPTDREAAIDNAIRAFDRMRLSKDDKAWQMLLPSEERGKGKILSRLHSGMAKQENRVAPQAIASSPMPDEDDPLPATKGTPKLAASSTPRLGSTTAGKAALTIEQRFKASQKQRAKEQKAKDKEAAASDRETTKPRASTAAKKKTSSAKVAGKVKSDEVVHSSDENDDVELAEHKSSPRKDSKLSDSGRPAKAAASSKLSPIEGKKDTPVSKPLPTAAIARSAVAPAPKRTDAMSLMTKTKDTSKPASTSTPKVTPSGRAEKHVRPAESSTRQLSPQKLDSKPKIPSPLGPVRPRNESDASTRASSTPLSRPQKPAPAVKTAKRPMQTKSAAKQDVPASTSEALPPKKRPLSDSSDEADRPHKSAKLTPNNNINSATSADNTISASSGNHRTLPNSDSALKRKANDISTNLNSATRDSKHQRTESSSSRSIAASSSLASTTARTSPDTPVHGARSPAWREALVSPGGVSSSSSSASMAGPPLKLTWVRALEEAEKFRTTYYPAYVELFDRLQAMPRHEVKLEERKKLFEMHRRLKQMKRDIQVAAE